MTFEIPWLNMAKIAPLIGVEKTRIAYLRKRGTFAKSSEFIKFSKWLENIELPNLEDQEAVKKWVRDCEFIKPTSLAQAANVEITAFSRWKDGKTVKPMNGQKFTKIVNQIKKLKS